VDDILTALRNEGEAVAAVERRPSEVVEKAQAILRAKWNTVGQPALDGLVGLRKEKQGWLAEVNRLPWSRLARNSANQVGLDLVKRTEQLAVDAANHMGMYIAQLEAIPARIAGLTPEGEAENLMEGSKTSDHIAADILNLNIVASLRRDIESLEWHLEELPKRRVKTATEMKQPVVTVPMELPDRRPDTSRMESEFNPLSY